MPAMAAARVAGSPPRSIASNVGSVSRAPPAAVPGNRRTASLRTRSDRSSTAACAISSAAGVPAPPAACRPATRTASTRTLSSPSRAACLTSPHKPGLGGGADDRLPLGGIALPQRHGQRALGVGRVAAAGGVARRQQGAGQRRERLLGAGAHLAVRIADQLDQRGKGQLGGGAAHLAQRPRRRRAHRRLLRVGQLGGHARRCLRIGGRDVAQTSGGGGAHLFVIVARGDAQVR